MKIIGITGGVGSGKSALLSKIKEKYNCRILLSDDAAKHLEEKGESAYAPLVDLLGNDILDDDLNIDKKKMAAKIFGDNELLAAVNDIIHPLVKEYILNEIAKEKDEGKIDYFFLEAALLIECGYRNVVDQMWYIFANNEVRFSRLKASRGYTDEKIKAIMLNQLSDEEYRNNSDVVIDNSGDLEDSLRQVAERLG